MTVVLLPPHWAANQRIQSAANNNPWMAQGESDHTAITLLQQALIQVGFSIPAGVTGNYGQQTADAVIAAEQHFGFAVDAGVAGREVFGSLDLALRGWSPPAGAHFWGPCEDDSTSDSSQGPRRP